MIKFSTINKYKKLPKNINLINKLLQFNKNNTFIIFIYYQNPFPSKTLHTLNYKNPKKLFKLKITKNTIKSPILPSKPQIHPYFQNYLNPS